jgi:subtilisin-like proprotein convertase family protein
MPSAIHASSRKKRSARFHPRLEELEPRLVPSATDLSQFTAQTFLTVKPQYNSGQSPAGYWPSQVRHAYGFDQLSQDGTGQTIAIVDAYGDPNLARDLAAFDAQFKLAAPPTFTQVSQTGGPDSSVQTDPTGGWEVEEALDVEWAHAIAPKANILLVEANSANLGDLLSAVSYATSQPNVVAVSMSWGGGEFAGEASYDSYFTTPTGHKGITFVAAAGDNGVPPEWPAASSNVLAVGGTSLGLSSTDTRTGEPGWSSGGGGYSAENPAPSYQNSYAQSAYVQNTLNNHVLQAGSRGTPDVSYNADSSPGVAVYDTFRYYGTSYTWWTVGGTSAGSPQWAGLVALVDQARGTSGSLDGPGQLLPDLYKLASSSTSYPRDFFDVTSGNNGEPAQPGFDLVTGLGSPQANNLIPDLVGNAAPSPYFTVSAPSTSTAGTAFSVTITAYNGDGTIDTGYTGTVQFTSSDGQAGLPSPATFTSTDGGVLTVSGADLKTAGLQTVTVTDTKSSLTGTASVTVNPGKATSLSVTGFPSSTHVGTTGTFTVTARDAYGNVATGDNDTITFTSSDPKALLPAPSALSGGKGTFSATFNTTGTQSLTAQDSAGPTGSQTGIVVNAAPSGLTFNSPDVPAPILGGYATVSSLNIGSNVTIANLTVKLNISYPTDGDLYVALVSPSGTVTALSYYEGGSGANFQNTVFDSTAAAPIRSAGAPFSGTYRPDGNLSVYNTRNARGTWQLWVEDFGGHSGTLTSWSLTITPSSSSPTGPAFASRAVIGTDPSGQVAGVVMERLPAATSVAQTVATTQTAAQGTSLATLATLQAATMQSVSVIASTTLTPVSVAIASPNTGPALPGVLVNVVVRSSPTSTPSGGGGAAGSDGGGQGEGDTAPAQDQGVDRSDGAVSRATSRKQTGEVGTVQATDAVFAELATESGPAEGPALLFLENEGASSLSVAAFAAVGLGLVLAGSPYASRSYRRSRLMGSLTIWGPTDQ